jgi:hypothetical protein
MRNSKGQFKKGHRPSPDTEFKPGQHWRPKKPYWDKDWLQAEYVDKQRSSGEIAADWNVTDAAILFWLRKHGIEIRTVSEAREVKHWGSDGESNPMYGRKGKDSSNWKGGVTPLRQRLYSSREWADAVIAVWDRDKGVCQRCGTEDTNRRKMHIHHIVSYENEDLVADPNNLVLLCAKCHYFVHGEKNVNREFLADQKGEN